MADDRGDPDIKMEAPSDTASPLPVPPSTYSGSAAPSPRSYAVLSTAESVLPTLEIASGKQRLSVPPQSSGLENERRSSVQSYGDTTEDDEIVRTMADRIKQSRRLGDRSSSSSEQPRKKIKNGSETPVDDDVDMMSLDASGATTAEILRRAVKAEDGARSPFDPSKSSTPPAILADMLIESGSKLGKGKPNKASPAADGEIKSQYLGVLGSKPKPKKATASKKGTARAIPAAKKPVKTKGGAAKALLAVEPQSPKSDESGDGEMYCICRGPDGHRWMVACDTCDNWFHGDCVGILPENQQVVDKYVCPACETEENFTNYIPFCRLESCRLPSRIYETPASDYCSKEHQLQFLNSLMRKLRTDDKPSFGGELNAEELGGLVMAYDGDQEKWQKLFERPTLDKGPDFAWDTVYNEEEREIVSSGDQKMADLEQRISDLRDQTKLVQMIITRAEATNEGRDKKHRLCGFDLKLTFTLDEFLRWRETPEGQDVFAQGQLPVPERPALGESARYADSDYIAASADDASLRSMCVRSPEKDCKRHQGWAQLQLDIQRGDIKNAKRAIRTIRARHHDLRDAAEKREALRTETDRVNHCEDVDPRWRDKVRAKFDRVRGLKDPRYGIPVGREAQYAGMI